VTAGARFSVAGLFAGIGGLECGLAEAGGEAELLCEWWEPAARVLGARFPGVPVAPDVRELRSLPKVDSPWLPWRLRTLDSFLASSVVLCRVGPLELVGSGLRESRESGSRSTT
jgi:hypothetical protein